MHRSVSKGPYVEHNLLEKILALKGGEKSTARVKTFARSSMIINEMIGMTIEVHNGKGFKPVQITEDMVGHKLGEFVITKLKKIEPPAKKNNQKGGKGGKKGGK